MSGYFPAEKLGVGGKNRSLAGGGGVKLLSGRIDQRGPGWAVFLVFLKD